MRKTSLFTSVILSLQLVTFGSEITKIKSILKQRLDQDQGSAAVGIITRSGMNTFYHGNANGDSIFELCSVTKVFTATLLADMTVRNELQLHDPVNKLLGVRARTHKDINLFHLATHTSGLPRSAASGSMIMINDRKFDFERGIS
ncbi:MAG: serine hydrolase [Planctomycetota bacterium]|nr:MAG: serine hydrolase [Planctomycetota bacterium]